MANKLKESLETFNLVELPVVDLENKLLAGHMRMFAMKALGRGEEEIEVRVPNRALTDDEFKKYNLISNKVTGEWDWEALKDWDPTLLLDTGFMQLELKDHFDLGGEKEPEKPIDPSNVVMCGMGDLFLLGDHVLLVGQESDPKDVIFIIEKWEKKTKRRSEKLIGDRRTAYLASISQKIDPV